MKQPAIIHAAGIIATNMYVQPVQPKTLRSAMNVAYGEPTWRWRDAYDAAEAAAGACRAE